MSIFTGVGVALVTVRDARDVPDAEATGALAARLVARGMQAVLACGTTGEAGRLSDDQRTEVIAAVRVGCAARCTRHRRDWCRELPLAPPR